MAIFIPTMQEIMTDQMEQPTDGELHLLNQLQYLPNDYTIYFQSHVNSLHPDIVIVKEHCGVLIIEVKDWNLGAYEFEADFSSHTFGIVRERAGHHQIRNPFEQVSSYKDELFNLYSSALFLENLANTGTYGVIKTAVYFATASEQQVKQFFGEENFKGRQFKKYYSFWAKDSANLINDIHRMLRLNEHFTNAIYRQIRSLFTLSLERREQAQVFEFVFSNEQKKYINSQAGKRQKIKGVAGSGKTLVLAQRAVNCYKRVQEEVLILTFNITLPNYIHDKISQITRDLTKKDKKQFTILPIHDFAKKMLREHGIKISNVEKGTSPDTLLRMRFESLKKISHKIKHKYQAILIDEVQDFEFDWLCSIEELFLAENGELVLFGDEKQNIYNRAVDEKKLPRTRISGPWSLLRGSYRLSRENCKLATEFQNYFFQNKYEKNVVEYAQLTLADILLREDLRYYYLPQNINHVQNVFNIIESFRNEGVPIAFNDICVLSDNHEFLRQMEYYLRNVRHIEAETISETQEEYDQLCRIYQQNDFQQESFGWELNELRRRRKCMFFMNPGIMKLCTVHSFKGWEINTVVLILEPQEEPELQDELIYTAITRAKNNLLIINLGNNRYHAFFEQKARERQANLMPF